MLARVAGTGSNNIERIAFGCEQKVVGPAGFDHQRDQTIILVIWGVGAENETNVVAAANACRLGSDTGLLRYFRTKAIIRQTGQAAPIAAYAEGAMSG